MPDTHDLGKFFWHRIRLRTDAPRHHRYWTQEYEWPYRASESHVLRLFGHAGIVVGQWHGGGLDEESPEYEQHLNKALQGRTITTNGRFREIASRITYTVRHAGKEFSDEELRAAAEREQARRGGRHIADEERPDATRMIPAVDA